MSRGTGTDRCSARCGYGPLCTYGGLARRLFDLTAPTLLVIALIIAAAGQILVDVVGADPAILLPGVVLIYGGLLSAWHDA